MEKNMIRVSSGKVRGVHTITECARYIVDKQIQIGEFLHKDDWILFNMRPVNLKDSQSIVNASVKEKKKEIRRNTIIKDIPDDFVDDIPFTEGFFGSREYDDGSSFYYHVDERSSSLLISNFDKIDGIKDFATLKTFV
ncbi:MAG TPA: hypothetical protein VHC47_11895, partial [Mucilaginibacter sp.]|nr:hypothetical protein [Mucilaginibacter sp.]